MTDNPQFTALLAACHWIGDKGWCPATGGNMSLRLDERQCLVTESGKDKGSLSAADFLRVDIADNHVPSGRTPSAETGLHTLLYRLSAHIGAVLHTHSVNATVLSRVERGDALVLQGYEMQKSRGGPPPPPTPAGCRAAARSGSVGSPHARVGHCQASNKRYQCDDW